MLTSPASFNSIIDRFAPLMARTGAKDRGKIEKHLAACDAERSLAHGRIWRRLATALGEIVPLPMQSAGNNSWRFFIPDGKYRMQVFALEDPGDGTLRIYMPDILAEAIKAKVLTASGNPPDFIAVASRASISIVALTADDSADAQEHFKHMLGWNRRAIRVTVSLLEPEEPQMVAVEALIAIAAQKWS